MTTMNVFQRQVAELCKLRARERREQRLRGDVDNVIRQLANLSHAIREIDSIDNPNEPEGKLNDAQKNAR
jgi:hypothetical protein